jgi:uncharacterized protein YggE
MSRTTSHWLASNLFLATLLIGIAAGAAERTVSVSGSGVVEVPPDNVAIDLQLKSVDDDLVRVRGNSVKQLRAVLELAQKHGVKAGDFEVSHLELALSFNEQLRRQIYNVTRKLSVKLGTLSNLNPLLSDLLKQPDVKVLGIRFGTSKAREHELEARGRAVAEAKDKATHLAGLVGLKLGKALHVNTDEERHTPFVTSIIPVVGKSEGSDRSATQNRSEERGIAKRARDKAPGHPREKFVFLEQADGKAAAEGPVDEATFGLGLIEFSVSVSIDFELGE